MPFFRRYIGIDYSGRDTPESRTPALQAYLANGSASACRAQPPKYTNWSRREIAEWLMDQLRSEEPAIIGIDHAFGFPIEYLDHYGLKSWEAFLDDFAVHWPTADRGVRVKELKSGNERVGTSGAYRRTEECTSSAKSVFHFGFNGEVATSTHAGLPWLQRLRFGAGMPKVHVWPFDGWSPPVGTHVVVEAYPSLYSRRYDRGDRSPDQQDAYATASWLRDMDRRNALERFYDPPLTTKERAQAEREGWILGVM